MLTKENKGITLVALVITIIILLLLAGIAIASLGGKNGIFAKVKQAKKAHIESEMKEQLTMGLQELQIAKQGNATLDDVTQDWANEAILSDYSPILKEDASLNGKLIVMTKDNVKGKFLIGQNLDIETIEYNKSSVEIEYTTISRTDNKVKINIVATDKINGVKQIEYPEGNPLKVVRGTKDQISVDYEIELGQEYKFVIITGDGSKIEKTIRIDDYYYNVTKDLGEGTNIDNNETKVAYNKTYEATISTEENYEITDLVVTMGKEIITTSGNDIVDINTGKIKIEKVTDDINIKVTTLKLQADGSWNDKKQVNSPQLMEGMTGVYWNDSGEEIKVTAKNQDNWYNYSAQKWANAKTKDGSYWVWIPRYAYKIESGRYTSTAGKISIKFLKDVSNKDNSDVEISTTYPNITGVAMSTYVVHPSFTDGSEKGKNNNYMNGEWDTELAGYWVAKYTAGYQECTQTVAKDGSIIEPTINTSNVKYSNKKYTSYNSKYLTNALSQKLTEDEYANEKLSYPVFKPLTYVYNCISAGDSYTISQEIAKASTFYGLNSSKTDSHQMKNSEWGAVSYLTQSSYGRNCTEVTINSKNLDNLNSKYINAVTGYAENIANGVSASTTNNKSGIFDLNGCVWERTSAYVSNGDSNLNDYGQSYASVIENANGYKTLSTKYATVYPYDSSNTGTSYDNKKSIGYGFGDAVLETSMRKEGSNSWNKDYSNFPYLTYSFFVRGGGYYNDSSSGMFSFSYTNGSAHYYNSFRSVLVSL